MANTWDPDIEITAGLAARLIEAQFPELAPIRLEPLRRGWDNAAFVVNGDLLFRFPCRQAAAHLVERENALLPILRPHLPLPVPDPIFIGRPAEDYPCVFHGYRLIPGRPASSRTWSEAERTALAAPLARFLSSLHAVEATDEMRRRAPHDELGRSDPDRALARIDQRLFQLEQAGADLDFPAVREAAQRLRAAPPWPRAGCWVHGDLYAAQILVDDLGRLTGVIDWGDVHLGDPALDISVAFTLLPPSARDAFRQAYGPIDAGAWDRARLRAIHYGVVLLHYGRTTGDESIAAAGRIALLYSLG
jgi:aminoglycoside phosphotransferase (APT) family kinase protein